MKRTAIYLLFISLTACNYGDKTKWDFYQWAHKGGIIDNVLCKTDPNLSYSLFLPSNYKIDRNWPVIYCFDPKSDGKLPLTLLKNVAEKYGYILIGSNNSKNGLQQTEMSHIIEILFEDTKKKIAIDPKRVYYAGFSGGARVACLIANSYKNAAGVIACSGAVDPADANTTYNLIGIAGNIDMNYLEMRRLETSLKNWPGRNIFLSFDGIHHWPPKETLEQAVTIMEIFAMKDKLIGLNDTLIKNFVNKNIGGAEQLEAAKSPDSLMKAYYMLGNTLKITNGLADSSKIAATLNNISRDQLLTGYLEKEKKILLNEMEKQQVFAKSINESPTEWWIKELNDIKNSENKAQNRLEKSYAKRLLAFVSLLSYSYVNNALAQQNWNAAEKFLKIYGLADPENPDYLYFLCCYYANTYRPEDAVNSLRTAIKFGFNDQSKLLYDPMLDNLRNMQAFMELINPKAPN